MDRRNFIKNLGLGTLAASVTATSPVKAITSNTDPSPYDIIVVGGGFGGASVAKYVALWGGSNVKVTLIDSNPGHVSCILSNLVLNGQKTLSNLTFNLSQSAIKHNFTFKQGTLSSLGVRANGNRFLVLASGETVDFDKLILAPGIDFIYPTGMENPNWTDSNTPFPHAWKAGLQTNNLRDQLKKLPSGGNARVIMTIPAKPYRCPPGPYERACLIADYLKTKKGGGKLYVLDANPYIQAEPTSFSFAFAEMYKGIIEYHPNTVINSVYASGAFNPAVSLPKDKSIDVTYNPTPVPPSPLPHKMPLTAVTKIMPTDKFHLVNVIPNQTAANFLFKDEFKHLLNGKKWAGVDLDTYQSSSYDNDIYIIGDAHDSIQPKAGHIANSEAKICADALLRALSLRPARVMPDEAPVTNSACFSPITATTASFLTTGFRYVDGNPGSLVKILEASGEAEQISSDNYKMMLAWANNLFSEVF